MAIDITALYNVSSEAVKEAAKLAPTTKADTYTDTSFNHLLNTAIDNINTTNRMKRSSGRLVRPKIHMTCQSRSRRHRLPCSILLP